MAVKIIYFVHGTTTDSEKEISSGWSDVGLSELGVKQSVALKNQIKDNKIRWRPKIDFYFERERLFYRTALESLLYYPGLGFQTFIS